MSIITDEPEDDGAAGGGHDANAELLLQDGSCWILDPDYLDPSFEVEGVLAVQCSTGAGLWKLVGQTDSLGKYEQVWLPVGADASKNSKLKSVN